MHNRLLFGYGVLLVVACTDAPDTSSAPSTLTPGPGPSSTLAAGPTASDETSLPVAPVNPVSDPTSNPSGGQPSSTTSGPASSPALGSTSDPSGATATAGPPPGPTQPTGSGPTPTGPSPTGGPQPSGGPTCMSGVQTGDACNSAADTEPCVRSDRTCECGSDSTWMCAMNSGAGGVPAGSTGSGGDSAGGGGPGPGPSGSGGGTGSVEIDCDAMMPTSGGEQHSNTWAQGGSDNLAWQVWTNGGPGTLTTYEGVPAFIASWNNSGDYLGRMGFEWGNNGKSYTEYGTIKADYVWNKSGTAGQYSYIGIYGWSNNPCVEWYIVEDSFHQMPFNTGDRPVGTTEVDGGTYNLVYRHTSGTGGDRCGGAGSWDQFYSIRLEGKRCGTITVSDHFDAWAAQGWNLGSLIEVKVVVEAAAGQGSVEFPLARVTTSQ